MCLSNFEVLKPISPLLVLTQKTSHADVPPSKFFNLILFETSKFSLRLWDVLVIALVILITTLVLRIIKSATTKSKKFDKGKQYSLYNLIRYVVLTISVMWVLQYLGMKLTILLGGSAALLVGIGLGLQNMFSDFVSGIILLIDSSIKVGDIIEVNNLVSQVSQINLRTTQVVTRDDKYILLPNSSLTKNNIINWTHNLDASRFDVSVGVGYDSDVDLVKRLFLEVVDEHDEVMKAPKPFVRLNDFGDSSIRFTVYFWSHNIFRVENIKSDIRFAIFRKFNKYHIDIPLPQHVIHQYKEERGSEFKRYHKDDIQ